MENEIVTVDFHGDTLFAARVDERVLIAVKPIATRFGLDWKSQWGRISRDALLSEGVVITTIPSLGGDQDTVCLPLDLIPGFLFGIDDRRIKDVERREVVLRYKRECYRVLYQHFFGKPEEAVGVPERATAGDAPLDEWRTWLSMIDNARRIYGNAAARRLWARSPLPSPERDHLEPADDIDRFLAEATAPKPDGMIGAAALYACYAGWAQYNGVEVLPFYTFGRQLGLRGIPSVKKNGHMSRVGIGWSGNIHWDWGLRRPAAVLRFTPKTTSPEA